MAALRVANVTADRSSREAFHAVATSVYADQPPGTAPLQAAVDRNLDREAFQSAQQIYVAFDRTEPVGRVVARVSTRLLDENGHPFGLLGFFEGKNRHDATDALFREAIAWLQQRGARRVIGPMDGDTWHRYRVNVGPFERPPFPLEPWNPPHYEQLWTRAGFREVETYTSKWIEDVSVLLGGLQEGVARSESRGVKIRGLDTSRVAEELAVVHEISSEIFADAFLYSPVSRDEFLNLYSGVERFLDPDLVFFATAPGGKEVGFVFAYADPRQPAVHYKTIGVRKEWRRAAVAAALSHHGYTNALKKGLPAGNHALMRDDNRSQALDQGYGEVFRRYVLYEWNGA